MSTVDEIEQSLCTQLLRGELTPGQRLGQDDLARQLGVSKIPVREALQRLAGRGLITFESNRGATVAALTAAEADENFSLRMAIEPLLLRQAIPQITIVDLAQAELALTSDTHDAEANWRFHHALYLASGWSHGLAIAERLHVTAGPYVSLYSRSLGGADGSETEHRAMLDACREGDPDRAVAVLEAHLHHARRTLTDFLASMATSGGDGAS